MPAAAPATSAQTDVGCRPACNTSHPSPGTPIESITKQHVSQHNSTASHSVHSVCWSSIPSSEQCIGQGEWRVPRLQHSIAAQHCRSWSCRNASDEPPCRHLKPCERAAKQACAHPRPRATRAPTAVQLPASLAVYNAGIHAQSS